MDVTILDKPFNLTPNQIAFYKEHSFIKLKKVLPPEIINHYNEIISNKVSELNKVDTPLHQRDTYGKAFLQLFNLWTTKEEIRKFVFSPRLAQIATQLMEVDGVRIYHDQALFKEAGGGITPWHADQYYWPLSSDKTITVWVPLQSTPLEMGPLEFSAGSQHVVSGRELSIGDESEREISENLKVTDFPHIIEAFDIGEVSYHSGWVFHRAGANQTDQTRKVMTVIYMDKDICVKKPENKGQDNDWKTWCPGVKIGGIANSPINPILFEK